MNIRLSTQAVVVVPKGIAPALTPVCRTLARAVVQAMAGIGLFCAAPGILLASNSGEARASETKRGEILEDKLSAGLLESNFYELHKGQIHTVLAVSLLQGGFIAALVIQRRRSRKFEKSLQESDAWIKQAAAAVNMGMWMWTCNTDSVHCSTEARPLLDLGSEGPFTLMEFFASLAADDRKRVCETIITASEEDGNCAMDVQLLLPGGGRRWLLIQGSVDHTIATGPRRMRGILKDITIRKENERAFRESEQRFRLVVDAAPSAMLMVHSDGRIVFANARAEKMFRYPLAEILTLELNHLIPERFRSSHARQRAAYLNSPHHRAIGAGRNLYALRRDGSEIPVEIDLNPMDVEGESYVLASIMDITERKRTEAELQQQRQQLTHLTRISILGEISGSLGHELNQPLAAIQCSAEAAIKYLENYDDHRYEIEELLLDIVEADKRASDIVARLRAMLRRDETPHTLLDMNSVVKEVLRIMQGELNIRHIPAALYLATQPLQVKGDGVQIQQVLINLILNACDAMNDIPLEGRAILLRTLIDREGMIRVSVEDHGHGIPFGMTRRIFEPFYTTKKHGLGIGLSICSTIVANHGGSLKVSSKQHRGTIVSIVLPCS